MIQSDGDGACSRFYLVRGRAADAAGSYLLAQPATGGAHRGGRTLAAGVPGRLRTGGQWTSTKTLPISALCRSRRTLISRSSAVTRVAFHGAPRFTGNLDILVCPDADHVARVLGAVREFEFPADENSAGYLLDQHKILTNGAPSGTRAYYDNRLWRDVANGLGITRARDVRARAGLLHRTGCSHRK